MVKYRYQVISVTNIYIFEKEVTKLINDGWELVGGVCVDCSGVHHQAMYKIKST